MTVLSALKDRLSIGKKSKEIKLQKKMEAEKVLHIKKSLDGIPFTEEKLFEAASKFETPFHLYDEKMIRQQCKNMKECFLPSSPNYINYFAVKATPTPHILKIMQEEGFGADCSSLSELILSEKCGFKGEQIMFTSNNTPAKEYIKAIELGAIINFDDMSQIDFLYNICIKKNLKFPELVSFRFNPGPTRTGNVIIGDPKEAKYGFTRQQLINAYLKCKEYGSIRFALHTMVISCCIDPLELVATAEMCFDLCNEIFEKTKIKIEMINLGGGIGVPYKVDQSKLDLSVQGPVSQGIKKLFDTKMIPNGFGNVKIVTECGRYVTAPCGWLVTQVIHQKKIYKNYIGVDACMANLMRPGMYEAYHHITPIKLPSTVINDTEAKEDDKLFPWDLRVCRETVSYPENKEDMESAGFSKLLNENKFDIVGGLCENNDKFAIDRPLYNVWNKEDTSYTYVPEVGDYMLIHESGAHGHSMGFQYNGKLRSAEILLKQDGTFLQIRRPETRDDLFACLPDSYEF